MIRGLLPKKKSPLPTSEERIDYYSKLFSNIRKDISYDIDSDSFVSPPKIKVGVQILNVNREKITSQTYASPACWFVWVTDQHNNGHISYENVVGKTRKITVKDYTVTIKRIYW